MKQFEKISAKFGILFFSLLVLFGAGIFVLFFYPQATSLSFRILFTIISIIFGGVFVYAYLLNYEKLYKTIFLTAIFVATVLVSYVLLKANNLLDLLYSAERIKELILDTGSSGKFVFFLIQFAQVALVPIPAVVTIFAGLLIYGPFDTFIITSLGVIAGSLFAFFVWGRLLGYKMVSWVAGVETTDKYRKILNERGKYLLVLMFIFPLFPDDILCMVAGITTMSAKFFTFITITIRPVIIFVICYFGGGVIIPYSGWGLIAWPILLVLMCFAFYYTYKYREKIEAYATNKFFKTKS